MVVSTRRNLMGVLTVASMCAGCADSSSGPADTRERAVYTTFYPTTYFAEQIAQGTVPVVCPLPAGEDPIFWKPSVEVIGAYQRAGLIVINGASFENWVAMTSLPDSRVVNTAAGLTDAELITHDAVSHSHGLAGAHTHEGINGYVWLDPAIARRQAVAIADAMTRAFPEHAETFRVGLETLDADLVLFDDELAKLVPVMQGARILCSHPAYDYLGRRFGWNMANLDLDPGTPLTEAAWNEIEQALAGIDGDGRAIMLWASAPLEETKSALRSRHSIFSVVFSPCETPPARGDYFSEMLDNIKRLQLLFLDLGG